MIQLHRFARLSAACAFLLLAAGAMVTSTGSSLAVPDWPLSFGLYFPPMRGGVLFEHGHRMIAGAVALMTAALSVWIWSAETRRWVQWLAAAALGGILLQAVLGGVTVLYRLPPQVSISHAVLGQTVFCLILSIAEATSPECLRGNAPASAAIPIPLLWIVLAAAAVYAQLILGAVIRHTGKAVSAHILMALVAAGLVLWVSSRAWIARPEEPALARPALLLTVLVPLQLLLGLGAFLLRSGSTPRGLWQASWRTGHVACGAAILGACVILGWRVRRIS